MGKFNGLYIISHLPDLGDLVLAEEITLLAPHLRDRLLEAIETNGDEEADQGGPVCQGEHRPASERDLSIPDQVRQLEDYCRSKGWIVHKIFVEAGASARDENRPVFQEMLAEAKSKVFDVVLTLTASRFFRDVHGSPGL